MNEVEFAGVVDGLFAAVVDAGYFDAAPGDMLSVSVPVSEALTDAERALAIVELSRRLHPTALELTFTPT